MGSKNLMTSSYENKKLIDHTLKSIECSLPQGSKIVVGLSGGVDSSVSITLLKELGYQVIGLFMKNWDETSEDEMSCPAEKDFQDVAKTAHLLDVPYFSVNFTQEYRTEVFEHFIDGLKAGRTPNPDILCNLEIKFKHLLNKALHLGADALATGHYARCVKDTSNNQFYLQKSLDEAKDQTYFLYTASQHTLAKTVFPLGNIRKSQVRQIATAFNLPVATKKDSTGICFIGKRDFRTFISQYIGYTPGNMVTLDGEIVGEHIGLAYYTIGQRKGLGIGGRGDAWFVAKKRMKENELVVVQGEEHPALYEHALYMKNIHWIEGKEPLFPFACKAKIRYRQQDQACLVEKISDEKGYKITFDQLQRAITLEQSCVLYLENKCLGGGIITEV